MTVGAPERVVRLDLEYDGTAFLGWQRQAAGRTVQAVLEATLSHVLDAPTAVVGAGRTDAGVHATGAVASFRTGSALSAEVLARALDARLPEDVGVLGARDAPGFHALRDARWKWYRYTILRSRTRRVFARATSWRVGAPLDVEAMRRAGEALVGRRDFACFQGAGSPRKSTVRTLAGLAIVPGPDDARDLLHVDLVADGFLYGMARAIVGTLVEVGRGRRAPGTVPGLLSSGDRREAGGAAPAQGLTLRHVGYPSDAVPPFVDPALAADLQSGKEARPCESRSPAATSASPRP